MKPAIACIILTIATATAIAQGPLTPPGAPAPTMKTLDQIEPRIPVATLPTTISNSGSYVLTGNATGISGTNGITIQASNVTMDLGGFTLFGVAGSLDGIFVAGGVRGVTIRNGVLRDWDSDGIDASAATVHSVVISDIIALSNQVNGIFISSLSSVIRCTANQNGGSGIIGSGGGVGNLAKDCVGSFNTLDGISMPTSSSILDCVARDNFRDGFVVQGGCVLQNCSSVANDKVGIRITGPGTKIENCSATASGAEGIIATKDSYVYGNNCDQNGGGGVSAGILVTNSGSRIDSNHVMGNDIGIAVVSSNNFLVRNTVGQSLSGTNYQIVASNSIGGIVNVVGIGFTNSNPWVNFEM